MDFDPDGPAIGDGIFGLPHTREDAAIVLIPVPWEATVSYRGGTALGPAAIRQASAQVDLHDLRFGPVYEAGIFMEDADEPLAVLGRQTRDVAVPAIEAGGLGPNDGSLKECIDVACAKMNAHVRSRVDAALREGKLPGVVGGEHSVSYGSIAACSDRFGDIGVLHIDAHLDLRESFEGFAWSHASVMHNVLRDRPGVKKLTSVGIRDAGGRELALAEQYGSRCSIFTGPALFDGRAAGETIDSQLQRIVDTLPEQIYISLDIDGLDPSLCPHTGTPVPGGLGFAEVSRLLELASQGGRRIVGFDLVEVAPGPGSMEGTAPEWDANVGARLLYRLCGAAMASRQK